MRKNQTLRLRPKPQTRLCVGSDTQQACMAVLGTIRPAEFNPGIERDCGLRCYSRRERAVRSVDGRDDCLRGVGGANGRLPAMIALLSFLSDAAFLFLIFCFCERHAVFARSRGVRVPLVEDRTTSTDGRRAASFGCRGLATAPNAAKMNLLDGQNRVVVHDFCHARFISLGAADNRGGNGRSASPGGQEVLRRMLHQRVG